MQGRREAEKQVKLADTELREKKTLEELLPEVSQRCMRGEELMEKAQAQAEAV